MKYCENCGTLLEENAKFCQRCGMPTTEAQSAPQPDAPEVKTATPGMTNEPAGEAAKSLDELKQDLKKSLKEGRQAEATDFKKKPLWYIFRCLVVLVVIAVIFVQCSGTSKKQILETAKSFTLDNSDVTLGEAVETNLSDVEWTCYDQDDGYWTVTVSGYNANEDATVTLLIGVTEINDDQVYYETIYGEVNGSGSSEASDINYAIAIVYDNVGQALVDNLTSYLLGI